MAPRFRLDILAATRLTREGRLGEALALLRGVTPFSARAMARAAAPATEAKPEAGKPTIDSTTIGVSSVGRAAHPLGVGTAGTTAQRAPRPRSPGEATGRHDFELPVSSVIRPPPAADARGPAADRASFETGSFRNAAGARDYKVYLPSDRPARPMAVVVMLHGCTQSPDDFAAGTRMNALAERDKFIVVYPAQCQSANASRCWNWFNERDQHRDAGEPSLIAGLTRLVVTQHGANATRVYVAGLSAGGAKAAIMGATYPELYAAVGVHSGLAYGAARNLPSALAAMRVGAETPSPSDNTGRAAKRPTPTIVFHGDADKVVHPANGDHVARQAMAADGVLKRRGMTGVSAGGVKFTQVQHLDNAGRAMIEQWTVHGLGHAWSGGHAAGSHTDQRGPDASQEMVRFFGRHGGA